MSNLAYKTVPMPPAGTPEWLELRRTAGVGASECASVMGFNPWQSPLDVYLIKRGIVAPAEPTIIMRRGNHMEPFILDEFQKAAGFEFEKPDTMAVSIEHPWLFANLDGITADGKTLAEIKCSDATSKWGDTGTQDVPEYYYIQCQHQLLVTGAEVCYLAVMLSRAELRYYPIVPHKAVQDSIVEATGQFWNHHVANGIPPEGDASPEAVKQLYPAVDDSKEVELPAESTLSLLSRHLELNNQSKAIAEEMDKIKAQLMMAMGDARKAKVPGWGGSMTRSMTEASTFTVTRKAGTTFKINHPRTKGQ